VKWALGISHRIEPVPCIGGDLGTMSCGLFVEQPDKMIKAENYLSFREKGRVGPKVEYFPLLFGFHNLRETSG
jgi:hypothetical protein